MIFDRWRWILAVVLLRWVVRRGGSGLLRNWLDGILLWWLGSWGRMLKRMLAAPGLSAGEHLRLE
jgi:hypothetical protein